MRAITVYRERARECRELARMVHRLEDRIALDHAAQSWERLAKRCEREADCDPADSQVFDQSASTAQP
jgi:hypothetical protein